MSPKRHARAHRVFAGLLGCVALLAVFSPWRPTLQVASAQSAVLLVVVAHPNTASARLDHEALRAIFLRRRLTWSDGVRVLPFNYPAGDPLRVTFDRVVLGFGVNEAARYWIDARIRTGTEAPRSVGTPGLVARVVARLPGSVGYVPEGQDTAGLRVVARVSSTGVSAP